MAFFCNHPSTVTLLSDYPILMSYCVKFMIRLKVVVALNVSVDSLLPGAAFFLCIIVKRKVFRYFELRVYLNRLFKSYYYYYFFFFFVPASWRII